MDAASSWLDLHSCVRQCNALDLHAAHAYFTCVVQRGCCAGRRRGDRSPAWLVRASTAEPSSDAIGDTVVEERLFSSVGYSIRNGVLKLRFTNDKNRSRVLERKGHEGVNLYDLPEEMSRESAARWLARRRDVPQEVKQLVHQFIRGTNDETPARKSSGRGGSRSKAGGEDEPRRRSRSTRSRSERQAA